jgi:ribosomal protein S18 acetylase RimI-like enzyme
MTEAVKLVKSDKPAKQPKPVKLKVEAATPASIIECWKLMERSLRETHAGYPDLSEERPDRIRLHLFNYMSSPTFVGLVVRSGKKVVGQILCDVRMRALGAPTRYVYIWNLWVEPEYRDQGAGKLLLKTLSDQMRAAGIFHWEAEVNDELTAELFKHPSGKVQKLMNRLGGKIL